MSAEFDFSKSALAQRFAEHVVTDGVALFLVGLFVLRREVVWLLIRCHLNLNSIIIQT